MILWEQLSALPFVRKHHQKVLERTIMNGESQQSGNHDQLLDCPYDKNHQVESKRMEEHLTECRSLVSEKTVCPFDEQHVVFAPEIDYHKTICPQRPRETEESRDADKCNGENSGVPEDVIEYESSRAKGNSLAQIGKDLVTGCVRGQDVGGRGNQVSVLGHTEGDTDKKSPCDNQEEDLKKAERDESAIEENMGPDDTKPLNHKTAIEKQLSQSDSDTTETDASASGESDQERFDYLKYKPSKEERDEFLRLIRQEREAEVYEDKYTAMDQAYQSPLWAQSYTYVSSQYPVYPYLPFPNSYPVMTAIASQHPYTAGYFAPSMLPPGAGFMHSAHGAYECGQVSRPHHRFKRRNHHSHHLHSRYNNRYHNSDSQNQGDTDSNSSSQSDTGLNDDLMVTQLVSNGNHGTSKEACMKHSTNGGFNKKSSAAWQEKCHKKNTMEGRNGIMKHFVDIGNVEERVVNGNLSDSSQEKEVEGDRQETEEKKSEQEKQMRKLKKKIQEIVLLEKKRNSGASLDCDQLKKLSRKKDFEVELQYLSQSH